jgi:hypothetical protein
MAEKWCKLATHQIFETSGEHNMARISRSVTCRKTMLVLTCHRKLLLCAIARKDFGGAREIFSSMSKSAQNEGMTRFLMYKIALRCGESELAAECLQFISSATTKDPTLLYACCLDAQQSGNKHQTIAALQLVLEKYGYSAPSAIHLPSLIRTTIQLIVSLLDESRNSTTSDNMEVSVEKLCRAFEGGTSYLTFFAEDV